MLVGAVRAGAHGPDEHYSLEMFARGIDTAICFLEEIAR
jgi:acetylornithine deacetylase/succinyl-diaminopimelate desuccinylase-like protein